jgi:hypothetical protein
MPTPRHPIPALEPASARRFIASLTDLPAGDPLAACLAQADAWDAKASARHQELIKRRNAGANNLKRSVAIWDETMFAFRTALEAARNRQQGKPETSAIATPDATVEVEAALGQLVQEGKVDDLHDGKEFIFRAKPKTEPATAAKPSGLDAAAQVLREAGEPLGAPEMIKRILERGLWSTNGKTPAATIYAAIIREIRTKGSASRFQKVDRGRFTAT